MGLSHPPWKPGESGNPAGRPKGTGRLDKALKVYDLVLNITAEDASVQLITAKLREMIRKAPGAYLTKVWLPIIESMTRAQRHEIALIIEDRLGGATSGIAQAQLDALMSDPSVMKKALELADALEEAGARPVIDVEPSILPAPQSHGDNGKNGSGGNGSAPSSENP